VIFGEISTFAIEAEFDPPGDEWGHMRVWCRGRFIGDFAESHCALFTARNQFAVLSAHLDSRWATGLENVDGQALWEQLAGAWRDGDERFAFLVSWAESFDGQLAFLVKPPDCADAWIVCDALPSCLAAVPASAVIEASAAFVEWFDATSARLSSVQ
jgi:hypothetical protein